jgi:predicted RNase H-like HicB family nuclease
MKHANGGAKVTRLFEVVVKHCPRTPGAYKFAAEVPALPGCFSDGRTEREALENVKEAITLYLDAARRRTRRSNHLVEVRL